MQGETIEVKPIKEEKNVNSKNLIEMSKPKTEKKFKKQEKDVGGFKSNVIYSYDKGSKTGEIHYSKINDPSQFVVTYIKSEPGKNEFINLLRELHKEDPKAIISGTNFTEKGMKIFGKLVDKKLAKGSFSHEESLVLHPEDIEKILKKYPERK